MSSKASDLIHRMSLSSTSREGSSQPKVIKADLQRNAHDVAPRVKLRPCMESYEGKAGLRVMYDGIDSNE